MKKLYDGNVLTMFAVAAVAVGDVIPFDKGIGIAQVAGQAGDLISVDTVGVYEFPVANADAVAVGNVLYWDSTNMVATVDSNAGANVEIGLSWGTKDALIDGAVPIKIG